MYTDDIDFQKDLNKHKVYPAWQFIEYTRKNIDTVDYCKEAIKNLVDKMSVNTIRWEQDLFKDFAEEVEVDRHKATRVAVTTDNLPNYEVRVAGVKTNSRFLFDKLIRDFFQYAMNALDSISQIANAGLLANKGKAVDSVDFQQIEKTFQQQTYSTDFPKTAQWFESTFQSSEFKYIEAINNRTKHTGDINNKLSMGILGSANLERIGPFYRKDTQHNEKDLISQLQETAGFIKTSFDGFLDSFCDEFTLDRYIDNRYEKICGVRQQKIKNEPDQNLSYAYITTSSDFDSMPDEIYILFVNDKQDDVRSHLCPFENILVTGNSNIDILGRYHAEESVGDDCLLKYRKYRKDSKAGVLCLEDEMKKADTQYYHWNPFFDVETVTDDDALLARAASPI